MHARSIMENYIEISLQLITITLFYQIQFMIRDPKKSPSTC